MSHLMAVFLFALLRSGHKPGVYLLASLGSLILIAPGCHKETHQAPRIPPVPYVTPTQKTLPLNIHAIGKAQSTLNVQIVARTEGYLTEVLFKDGTDVEKGQKLFVPMPNKIIEVTVSETIFLDKEGKRLNA